MISQRNDVPHSSPARPLTILVVEDEPLVAKITKIWLEERNFDVIVSNDGREALARAAQMTTPIDLLLADVILPGMRGPVLAGAVRRSHPEAAVLFISGYSPELVAEISAPHTSSALVLHKPFTAEQLESGVALALARKAAASSDQIASHAGAVDGAVDADRGSRQATPA